MSVDSKPIIVALDFDDQQRALELVQQLDPSECRLKVGKEMFTYFGPSFVKKLVEMDFDVFLDLKFHDIPNTVAKAVQAAAKLGVWMVNVHASGGAEMMKAARVALEAFGEQRPLLTAVTVLTSMDQSQLDDVIGTRSINDQVSRLASLAQHCGLDGVVCSAQEASLLRKTLDKDFKLVTPGIRPTGSDLQDQKRVLTPKEAIEQGVDFLVMGRPVTKASKPIDVVKSVNREILSL